MFTMWAHSAVEKKKVKFSYFYQSLHIELVDLPSSTLSDDSYSYSYPSSESTSLRFSTVY